MDPFSAGDHRWMSLALQLARRGLNTTTPNPRVGCVLVRDGEVVGQGWHERAGEAHAEVHALRAAGARARAATAYVTLEPCAHHGRTPPCAEALIAAGVSRVVAAMQDPNPAVSGRGLKLLDEAGIDTACGLLGDEALELNRGFVSRIARGRPWLRIKAAASLDGRTALANGTSQWITGEHARADGHRWRARSCALLTGIGTILGDDPRLTVRTPECSRQPLVVIVDARLRTPPTARVFETGHVLVACAHHDPERAGALAARGAEVVTLPAADGQVDLWRLMGELGMRGVNEVLSEAGARLNGALIASACADELLLYLAPTLLGNDAAALLALPTIDRLELASRWRFVDFRTLGTDLRLVLRRADH